MPVWRCPHCGTPQPESSRCWVCHRSTTSCSTCRHFRRGIAGGLGLCGLDPRRTALRPTEVRPCWIAAANELTVDHRAQPADPDIEPALLAKPTTRTPPAGADAPIDRWSLWGELEA